MSSNSQGKMRSTNPLFTQTFPVASTPMGGGPPSEPIPPPPSSAANKMGGSTGLPPSENLRTSMYKDLPSNPGPPIEPRQRVFNRPMSRSSRPLSYKPRSSSIPVGATHLFREKQKGAPQRISSSQRASGIMGPSMPPPPRPMVNRPNRNSSRNSTTVALSNNPASAAAAVFPVTEFGKKFIEGFRGKEHGGDPFKEIARFLSSIRMGPTDAGLIMDSTGGLVWFTEKGLRILQQFNSMKQLSTPQPPPPQQPPPPPQQQKQQQQTMYDEQEDQKDDWPLNRPSSAVASLPTPAYYNNALGRGSQDFQIRPSMHTVEIFPQQAELGKIPLYAPSEASLPPRDQPEETGKRQPTESNKTSLSGFAGILNNIKPPSALPANLQLNSVIPKKTVQFNQSGKDALPPTPADILETDRRASKRVSQVIDPYLKQLERVSDAYTGVMLAPSQGATKDINSQEVKFMRLLNSSETISAALTLMQTPPPFVPLIRDAKSFALYQSYTPRVIAWISSVAGLELDSKVDFLSLMRSGNLFCRIIVKLFPATTCQLLEKGFEFCIHKIVFFLEFCRSIGLPSTVLFQISDLVPYLYNDDAVAGLSIIRAIVALELQARKSSGWTGPFLELSTDSSATNDNLSKNESITEPTMPNDIEEPPIIQRQEGQEEVPGVFNQDTEDDRQLSTRPPEAQSAKRESFLNYYYNDQAAILPLSNPALAHVQEEARGEWQSTPQASGKRICRNSFAARASVLPPGTSPILKKTRSKTRNSKVISFAAENTYHGGTLDREMTAELEERMEVTGPSYQEELTPAPMIPANPRSSSLEWDDIFTQEKEKNGSNRDSMAMFKLLKEQSRLSAQPIPVKQSTKKPGLAIDTNPAVLEKKAKKKPTTSMFGTIKNLFKRKSKLQQPALARQQIPDFSQGAPSPVSGYDPRIPLQFMDATPQQMNVSALEKSLPIDFEVMTFDRLPPPPTALPPQPVPTPPPQQVVPTAETIKTVDPVAFDESLAAEIQQRSQSVRKKSMSIPDFFSAEQQALKKRYVAITKLIAQEDTYIRTLTRVRDFLKSLMTKRRRQSRRISRMVDMRIAYPNNGQSYPSVTPGPFLFSGNSLKQQVAESDLAYHLRLQNEIDEITELHGVICQMLDVHNQLVENIEKALPEAEKAHESPSLIGDALMLFANKILKPYITYSVVTLVGMKKPAETRNFSEGEVNTIVSRIVTKFIGEHYIDPENGGPAASASSKVPSQMEWETFLRRPIQRLQEYHTSLEKIIGFETMTVEGNNDNIKIKVAKIKVQSIIKSIQDRLSIMRPWTKEDFMEMDIYDFTN